MTEHKPISPEDAADVRPSRDITFTPVPVRPRHDGWTTDRQFAFIEKLADTGSISAACKYVGMSRESVRKLRRHPLGGAFCAAMDAALDCCYSDLEDAAMERARKGVARPVFFKGEQVGEWRHYDERLTMFLLRFRRRHRFGPEADLLPLVPRDIPGVDPDELRPFDPEGVLDGCFVALDGAPDLPSVHDGESWLDREDDAE
jgi:hypothetical protein